jgi:hypothetical protein
MLRRPTTIHREGWYYLLITAIVFGGALFKEVNLLLILAGMLLGPVLLNWQAVGINLRGLSIDRKLPRGLSAGDWLSVGLHLSNARRRLGTWAVVVQEQIERVTAAAGNHHGDPPACPEVFFPYVPAGQSRKGGYRGRLLERGRYRFGPLQLSTRFPFGLFSRTITVGQCETLIVLPRLGRLTEGWAGPAWIAAACGRAWKATFTACASGVAAIAAGSSIGGGPPGSASWWCGNSPSRAAATWPLCWTSGSRSGPPPSSWTTWNWP